MYPRERLVDLGTPLEVEHRLGERPREEMGV